MYDKSTADLMQEVADNCSAQEILEAVESYLPERDFVELLETLANR